MNSRRLILKFALGVLLALQVQPLAAGEAQRCATDDGGAKLCLSAPALRIATLSPGATELTFAAGAGDQVIAGVNYSDYPPAALKLPQVGTHTRIDLEALLALQPDLIITWLTGNPPAQVEMLQALGLPLFAIEPRTFEGVSSAIERLAILAGTEQEGFAEAQRFRTGMAALAEQYRNAEPIRVFYQVWEQPLMTINNDHLIGKVLQLCGGVNVFGDMPRLVPRISPEVVLAANPQAILTGSEEGLSDDQLDVWKGYAELGAVARGNLIFVPASPISRPTPRLLEVTEFICQQLDRARER
ncbi:cobalamin-binding protein [Marinobacter sp. X15-166B]|uniref:cobalamin-binding protein n=1 Tax=Marinobacter sp. X15-166B TaxID=1897620 RepID=UPI00085C59AB|nr:cobalamin-binding protein [Marinobacter sp. X15-166B]OEY66238.1 cobalamin-binding protein [Marinobacter sp. X15-166B]